MFMLNDRSVIMLPSDRERALNIARGFLRKVSEATSHIDALSHYWTAYGYIRALSDLDILDAKQFSTLTSSLTIYYAKWKQPS